MSHSLINLNEKTCRITQFVSPFVCRYLIQKQKDPNKAHQIKLEVIVKALKWLEMDMDVDEVIFHFCTD